MTNSLNKLMPKLQKPIIQAAFLLSVLFVVYSLIYSTNLYPLVQLSDPDGIYVQGAEIYAAAQSFNKLFLNLTVFLLLISVSLFVFFTQRRRLYYLSNYLICLIFCIYAAALSVYNFVIQLIYRAKYLAIDFEQYKVMAEIINARYVKSTFFFDIGFVLSILMLVAVAFVVLLLIYKRRLKAETVARAAYNRAKAESDGNAESDGTENANGAFDYAFSEPDAKTEPLTAFTVNGASGGTLIGLTDDGNKQGEE